MRINVVASVLVGYILKSIKCDPGSGGGGGYTSISLTGMLVREQISTTQKNRMTLNSNPRKIECPKIQTHKNRMKQDAMVVKV